MIGRHDGPASRRGEALAAHAEAWQSLGRIDPLWAVLTEPAKRGRRWGLPDFLATGVPEVERLLEIAERLGRPVGRTSALDVGCGVGRLTLPLGERFESATGVDISQAMVERAREVARDRANVRFEMLGRDGAAPFPDGTFDLVLSMFVLQHLPSAALVARSLVELARLVRPDGLLVIQMAGPIPFRHRLQLRRRAYAILRRLGIGERVLFDRLGLSPMRLIGLRQADVRAALERSGLVVREVQADLLSRSHIDSFTYFAAPVTGTMETKPPDPGESSSR